MIPILETREPGHAQITQSEQEEVPWTVIKACTNVDLTLQRRYYNCETTRTRFSSVIIYFILGTCVCKGYTFSPWWRLCGKAIVNTKRRLVVGVFLVRFMIKWCSVFWRGGGWGSWLTCLMRNEDVNYLHVFPERAGVRVGLVAHFANVRFVWRVHVHVLFPVAAVGEPSVTAIKFTLKRLLTCGNKSIQSVNDPNSQNKMSLSGHL